MTDQPTGEAALGRLAPLVGGWRLEARTATGEVMPGEGNARFEWHESGAHLVAHSRVDVPGAPTSVSIIGCDAANGDYYQLYSDDRGVCRVYAMSIDEREWRLWRQGDPFAQRFTGELAEAGNKIIARWEKAVDERGYEVDFYLTYIRVRAPTGG